VANGKAANFLEGSAPALPKIFGTSGDVPSSIIENFFGASGDAPSNFFQPALAGFVLVDTDFSWWTNWEGEAPAEPKRRRFANSDWRMVKRQRMVSSEW